MRKSKERKVLETRLPGDIGKRGELNWRIEDDGCLVIRGMGWMRDFCEQNPAPWQKQGSPGVRKVRIEAGVVNIGSQAFRGMEDLTAVELGPDVKRLGWRAFYGCKALETVRCCRPMRHWLLPETAAPVIRMGHQAFRGTPWQDARNPGLLIHGDTVLEYLGREDTVTVPEGIRRIASMAFEDCPIRQVVLPKALEMVGAGAFAGTALRQVRLPAGLRQVDGFAFGKNPYLTRVYLGRGVKELHPNAFGGTPVAQTAQCRYGSWLLGKCDSQDPERRFLRLDGRGMTEGNLRRVLKDGGVVLAVRSYAHSSQYFYVTSLYYDHWGELRSYHANPYLAQEGMLGETAVEAETLTQWRRRYTDPDTWISLSGEGVDWLSTDESRWELRDMLRCARKGTGGLFVSWDKDNVYGPLELDLAKFWLDTHPETRL